MRVLATLAVAAVMLATLPVQAQEKTPTTPLWEIHLDVQKALVSPLGQKGMQLLETEKPAKFDEIVKLCEAIGLDPRTDIGEVVLFGDGFEKDDATVVINLGASTGNLEGWVLAAPGYKSEELDGKTQLHSMPVEGTESRAWFAIPQHQESRNFVLIGSLDRERTTRIARRVLAGQSVPVPNPLQGNSVFSFKIHDFAAIPIKVRENDPGAAILKIIDQVGLTIGSDDENLSLDLEVSANSAVQARQISQLLTGLIALGQLAPAEKVPAEARDLLTQVVVEQKEGESQVHASVAVPYTLLEKLSACCHKK